MKVPAPQAPRISAPASLHANQGTPAAGGHLARIQGWGFGRAFARLFEGQRLGRELGGWGGGEGLALA